MNDGWVKLYRSTLNNDVFQFDPTAWRVFEVLLLVCDRKNGCWKGGREDLATLCRMSKSSTTVYKATIRLEKAGMIRRLSNSRFTTIYICNWSQYQGNGSQPSNSTVTAESHYNNNKKENKNNNKVKFAKQIRQVYDFYIEAFNKNPKQYKLSDQRKLKIKARLNDAGMAMLKQAITNTANSGFHTGDNDRGWKADLDFIIRSYEQVEKLSNMAPQKKVESIY